MKFNKRKFKNYISIIFIILGIILFIAFNDDRLLEFALTNNNLSEFNELRDTYNFNNKNEENQNFKEAKVKRVIDGDTIVVTIEQKDYKIRLIGVNTPESTTKIEEYGKEASQYTKSVLTVGKTIFLEKDVSETDKYGRLLRYIWLEVPSENIDKNVIRGKMFNAHLLLDGYAQIATYPPDVKYVNIFKEFEKEAKEKNIGLWGL